MSNTQQFLQCIIGKTIAPQAQTHAFHMPPMCQGKVELKWSSTTN